MHFCFACANSLCTCQWFILIQWSHFSVLQYLETYEYNTVAQLQGLGLPGIGKSQLIENYATWVLPVYHTSMRKKTIRSLYSVCKQYTDSTPFVMVHEIVNLWRACFQFQYDRVKCFRRRQYPYYHQVCTTANNLSLVDSLGVKPTARHGKIQLLPSHLKNMLLGAK